MKALLFERKFTINQVNYRMWVDSTFECFFEVESGRTNLGKVISFEPDYQNATQMGLHGWTKNPIKVLRQVGRYLNEFLRMYNPNMIYFTALEVKRAEVYQRLLLKYLPKSYMIQHSEQYGTFIVTRH